MIFLDDCLRIFIQMSAKQPKNSGDIAESISDIHALGKSLMNVISQRPTEKKALKMKK